MEYLSIYIQKENVFMELERVYLIPLIFHLTAV